MKMIENNEKFKDYMITMKIAFYSIHLHKTFNLRDSDLI